MRPSRRDLVGAAGTAGLALSQAPAAAAAPATGGPDAAWLQSVLERYAAFGDKASSGGPDDLGCTSGELVRPVAAAFQAALAACLDG